MIKRVVIADDDRSLVRMLALRCRQLGLRVCEAADGFAAALDIFWTSANVGIPDLLIVDINMPNEDGLSICEELNREFGESRMPVIVLTGRSDPGTIRRCEELGVHYVFKSGDLWQRLLPLIRQLLNLGPLHAPETVLR